MLVAACYTLPHDTIYLVTFQVQQGTGGSPAAGLQVNQQSMYMAQGGRTAAGFPVVGPTTSALQGPLAFLEKTTSNIGMPERRS